MNVPLAFARAACANQAKQNDRSDMLQLWAGIPMLCPNRKGTQP
jgi:hypothetical protein